MTKEREEFISFINDRLTGIGFVGEDEKWTHEQDIRNQTRVVIINGQRHDQPGETHHLKFEVEVFGDGEMKDVDTEVVNPFIEVNFNIYQDDLDVSEWPTFCMFFDDQLLFDSLLNKIFRL